MAARPKYVNIIGVHVKYDKFHRLKPGSPKYIRNTYIINNVSWYELQSFGAEQLITYKAQFEGIAVSKNDKFEIAIFDENGKRLTLPKEEVTVKTDKDGNYVPVK